MSDLLYMPPAEALDRVGEAGPRLALQLAVARDADQVRQVMAAMIGEVGIGLFEYVTATALEFLAISVLHPLMAASESAGADLRPGITKLLAEHLAGR